MYLFFSPFVNVHSLSYNFSALNISVQGFSLNFARSLGRAVDKLLNGLRVNYNSQGQFIFENERSLSLFRVNKTEGVISHIF